MEIAGWTQDDIELRFEPYGGGSEIISRYFEPGEKIRVTGKSTTAAGFPNALEQCRLDIYTEAETLLHIESTTNVLGHYWFDITLPSIIARATARVGVDYMISGMQYCSVPIGIGTTPDPVSPPSTWQKYLLPIGIGVFALVALALVLKRR